MKNSDRQGTGFMGSCIRLDAGRRGTLQSVRDTVQMATRTKNTLFVKTGTARRQLAYKRYTVTHMNYGLTSAETSECQRHGAKANMTGEDTKRALKG